MNPPDGAATLEEIKEVQAYLDQLSRLSRAEDETLSEDASAAADEEADRLRGDIEACRARLEQSEHKGIKLLGAGGFGVVFRGFDERLQRDIAIKMLRPSLHLSKSLRSRFALEAESLARCDQPGIIRVYSFGEIDDAPYMVTQFVDGPNLALFLNERKAPLPPRAAAQFLIAVAEAVQGMHERAFIHRDLKPSNILLARSEDAPGEIPYRPIITDFGFVKEIAKPVAEHSISSPIVGTVKYMAPEQALGRSDQVSIKTDIHALGAILFELLTGQAAFAGASRVELLFKIAREPARSIRSIHPSLSRTLEAIVAKCLEKSPERRYASAAELASDLRCYLSHSPTIARPAGPIRKLAIAANRNKWLTASWFLLLGALVVVAVLYRGQSRANAELTKLNQEQSRLTEAADASTRLAVEGFREVQRQAEEKWNMPGQMEDRLKLHLLAFSKFKQLAKQRNNDAYSRHQLSIAHHYLANAQLSMGDRENSYSHRLEGIAILELLAAADPGNAEYRFDLFMNYLLLGNQLMGQRRLSVWEKSRQAIEMLCEREPNNPTYLDGRNAVCYQLALELAESRSDASRAEKLARIAMASSAELAAKHPEHRLYEKYVSGGRHVLAVLASNRDDRAAMKEHFQQAIASHRSLADAFGNSGSWRQAEWSLRSAYLQALRKHSLHDDVIDEIAICLPLLNSLETWFPESSTVGRTRIELQLYLAEAHLARGDAPAAREWLARARDERHCEARNPCPERDAVLDAAFAKAEAAIAPPE